MTARAWHVSKDGRNTEHRMLEFKLVLELEWRGAETPAAPHRISTTQ
jgi:hypothetical protein